MNMIITLILLVLFFFAGFFVGRFLKDNSNLIVKIKQPLKLETKNPDKQYFLPPETVLYYDHSLKDGNFDVYRVYINVHGERFKLTPTEKDNLIIPLTAFNDN